MKRFAILRIAAAALCVSSTVTGCAEAKSLVFGEEFEFHCPQPPAPGLAVAVGARANTPAPVLPTEVRQLLVSSMEGCGEITVVRVDGRPGVVGSTVFDTAARTRQNFDIDKAAFLNDVVALLESAKAQEPEANVLEALSVASGAAGQGGTVVLLDSGVQTTDPLDFRQNELPTRQPAIVADALSQQGLLPDLAGRSVILSGLGYTATPQDALQERNRAFVVELWREIVVAAGAEAPVLLAEPNTSESAVTSPSVSTVRFPDETIEWDCDSLAILPDDGEVGFIPNEAEFRNSAAASAVLREFATFLHANPTARVLIRGYVAHYGSGDLSQRRADRVKRELSQQVPNTITAEGMGWGPFPNPTAPPDERYDQLNRRVTIEVTCG
ncbi:hypothetical protein ACN27F_18385 [Solwaraspora sp. WMMB335]|uniref:hypothetical protein n=1 Tax=Solwaraspora sp. WMMB335 TaxID=3404118 RepID=UPI003B93BE09